MAKFFKLGEKASSFYDPLSKMKLNPGNAAQFDGNLKRNEKVSAAKRNNHIQEITESEYNEIMKPESVEDNGEMSATKFSKLSLEEQKAYILDTYELDEADTEEVNGFTTKKDLQAKFKDLEEGE